MNPKPAEHDTNTDLRRLIDAGYSVTFTAPPAGYESTAYMVTITSETSSRWRCVDDTPGAALRAVWPLGYGPGQGGCGHCCLMGCTVADCPVCAAYGAAIAGNCGVCGYTDPDACTCGHQGADHNAMRFENATFPCKLCGCADFDAAVPFAGGAQ